VSYHLANDIKTSDKLYISRTCICYRCLLYTSTKSS